MNSDGSNRVNIGGNGDQSFIDWSPSGVQVSFTQNGDIWIMDSDGSNRQNITNSALLMVGEMGDGYFYAEFGADWGTITR